MNSETSSNPQSRTLKLIVIVFLLVSAAGFLDATYLTAKFFLRTPITCTIFNGCDAVTQSKYARIGPVPIALLGALYYLGMLGASVAYLESKRSWTLRASAYLTATGFLASLGLVYIQVAIIGALCAYCLFSGLTSTVLFGLGIAILRLTKTREKIAGGTIAP